MGCANSRGQGAIELLLLLTLLTSLILIASEFSAAGGRAFKFTQLSRVKK